MSVDHFSHGLLYPGESCVMDYIHSADETEVALYGERLPSMAHYDTAKGTLDNLALVVDCETVVAEDGAQLTLDVQLVLPVVQDKHCCKVWSAWDIVGRGMEEKHHREPLNVLGLHLEVVLLDFSFDVSHNLGHSHTRSQQT